jgi:hypothetical protein
MVSPILGGTTAPLTKQIVVEGWTGKSRYVCIVGWNNDFIFYNLGVHLRSAKGMGDTPLLAQYLQLY